METVLAVEPQVRAWAELFQAKHHALFLALCPVCAAKYKEFVKRAVDEHYRVYSAIVSAKASSNSKFDSPDESI